MGETGAMYREEFRRHLRGLGFQPDAPAEAIRGALRGRMGEARFGEYQRIVGELRDDASQNRLYDFAEDLTEANLLRSLEAELMVDVSCYLYERARPLMSGGGRIMELGCWSGGLTSFIASRHPECSVVGVDRVERIVAAAQGYFKLSNLGFAVWDYRQDWPGGVERADVLLCGLGVNPDCPLGSYGELDSRAIRRSPGYQREREEAVGYFRNWRQAAKEGAWLVAVLRLWTFPRYLAFVDAAQEAGWRAVLEETAMLVTEGGRKGVPSLTFRAERAEAVDEDLALSHWIRIFARNDRFLELGGGAALGFYRAFGAVRVLGMREYANEEGFKVREEVGVCGALGYVFCQDTRPDYRLCITSIPAAEKLVGGLAEQDRLAGRGGG